MLINLRKCCCFFQFRRVKLWSFSHKIPYLDKMDMKFTPIVLYSQTFNFRDWEGKYVDPLEIAKSELTELHNDVKRELKTNISSLHDSSHYYFDQQGKLFRPMTVVLMGKACNFHHSKSTSLSIGQRRIALISEMIHTASLLHDDVIDDATTRRNKVSVNQTFSHKQAVLAGNFVLSKAAKLLADIGSTKAVDHFSAILDDLVRGEMMQLAVKDEPKERFNHYIKKTYRKTASLIAYSCRSVSVLGDCPEFVQQAAFNYGKNLGIAFQLVDDVLDFLSSTEALGKPVGADISLGIATAPVLFAAEKFPDLHALIRRRFKDKGDTEMAFDYVRRSDGIEETFLLARKYASEAVRNIEILDDSIEKYALINLSNIIVERTR